MSKNETIIDYSQPLAGMVLSFIYSQIASGRIRWNEQVMQQPRL
jgi:hypothetical protein